MGGRSAWLAPHQDRRPAPLDGVAPPPPRRGLTHHETADPAERFAERAVAIGNEQRYAEYAGPGFPLRHGVVAFGRDEQRHGEPDIAVLQHDGNGGRLVALGRQGSHRDPGEFGHTHADFHRNAAHLAAEHDALAVEFNVANLSVRAIVAGSVTDGKVVGVEPQRAARPRSHAPAMLTPRNLPSRTYDVRS